MADRTYDVLALRGTPPRGEALLVQQLADETSSGEAVTGMLKLAQRFAVELLTAQGTMPFAPRRGTEFALDAARGRLRSELDVFLSFSLAAGEILARFRADERTADPDDERLAGVELRRVTVVPGSVRLTIELTSRAGTSRAVLLPVPTIPGVAS